MRETVKQALLTMGCMPIEQSNFPPDYRSVHEMIEHNIARLRSSHPHRRPPLRGGAGSFDAAQWRGSPFLYTDGSRHRAPACEKTVSVRLHGGFPLR